MSTAQTKKTELEETRELMELGTIFRDCLNRLGQIEKEYLAKLDHGPRTAKDVRSAALHSFGALYDACERASPYAKGVLDEHGYHLPWPLTVLYSELEDVDKGTESRLLVPDSREKRPKGSLATNKLRATARADAVIAFQQLVNHYCLNKDKVANNIAVIFQRAKTKEHNKTITAETVIEWDREARKPNSKTARLVMARMQESKSHVDDLEKMEYFHIGIHKVIVAQSHIESFNEVKVSIIYTMLESFIRGTSFD